MTWLCLQIVFNFFPTSSARLFGLLKTCWSHYSEECKLPQNRDEKRHHWSSERI